MSIPDALTDEVRAKLGSKLGKFAIHIERVSVRFNDVNGPKGGVDTVCRVKVSMHPLPTLVVEERDVDARRAFAAVSHSVVTAVRRALERAGHSAGRAARKGPKASSVDAGRTNATPDDGSLIGRRVWHSAVAKARALQRPEKRRRDAYVDTAQPGVSETDRRAGGGSTARRNTRGRTPKATVMLEDSATGEPSRKSTRRSANRQKAGENLARRARDKAASPQARAESARVSKRRA